MRTRSSNPTQATVIVCDNPFRWEVKRPSDYHVGDEVMLVLCCQEDGSSWYEIRPHEGHGIPGNMNSHITRYHGWRGTTNGLSRTACGLRKIIGVSPVRNRDYDYTKVTVGRDIHPDWE